jgi:hypothetical protein
MTETRLKEKAMPELIFIVHLWERAKVRLRDMRDDERGEVTEKVILVAIFAALAIAVGAIIVAKVTDKANSIPTQ